MTEYWQRNQLLWTLGFDSYGDYLASELWWSIRMAVWRRDGGKCRLCGERGEEAHHLDYSLEILRGQRNDLIVMLCGTCHQKVEFREDGTKRSVTQAWLQYTWMENEWFIRRGMENK
jgi:hypothetical protein